MGRVGGVVAEELAFESEIGCESAHAFVGVLCVCMHVSPALITRLYLPRLFPFCESDYLGIHLYPPMTTPLLLPSAASYRECASLCVVGDTSEARQGEQIPCS